MTLTDELLKLNRPDDPTDCLTAMLAKLRRQPRVVGRTHVEQAIVAAFLLGFGVGCDECRLFYRTNVTISEKRLGV